jgi:hypothetical protein
MNISSVVFLMLLSGPSFAASPDAIAPQWALTTRPFVYGREYFVLRSGRIQMIVQADRVDLGPAFAFLLFDAQDAWQSSRKEKALNFHPSQAFTSSALAVELGGFPYTALGHRTTTRWVNPNGVPSVEAVWWAGGVRVTEQIAALAGLGGFRRSVRLEGAHLVGQEPVTVRLSLPQGPCRREGSVLLGGTPKSRMALAVLGSAGTQFDEAGSGLLAGPFTVSPGSRTDIDTLILAQVGGASDQELLDRATALVRSSAAPEYAATRERWAATSTVSTKDSVVQDIFDKARYGLPGMIADDGTMDAGIFEYGAQWVRDTSNTVIGAVHTGQFELARNTLKRVLTKMISKEGVTMIAGAFDPPDREQFDQMGELLHLLKSYRDWTGDDSLLREHRELLVAVIERPLLPRFRDETGMVHNRREFWERVFDDAYELAYQTYVIQGLRDAADLAPAMGAEDRAERWRAEADRMLKSVLSHPTRALVHDGRLVKRRNVTGTLADLDPNFPGFFPDTPARAEKHRRLFPDTSQALPIALGIVDPRTDLARRTLDDLEQLWNTRWADGGYDRYHTSSQPDQPGPWPFATCFVLRAQHDAGLFDRSRRSLEWLNSVQGGRTGSWFEEIPSIRSTQMACGIVPWTSAEIALFVVRHLVGVRFDGDTPVLAPALYPGSPSLAANLRFRGGRLKIDISGGGPAIHAMVNGVEMKPDAGGTIRLPRDFAGGSVVITTGGDARP